MNRSESKYFNTARKMDDALILLLEKKDFAYITVKEICDTARVHRTTFYLHYETLGDLLKECIEGINQKFLSYFQENSGAFIERLHTCPKEELVFITPEYLTPYLRFVKENSPVFRATLQNPETMDSMAQYRDLYRYVFNPILERFDVPEAERSYIMQFYLNGILAVVQEWLRGDCEESIEEIGRILTGCIRPWIHTGTAAKKNE